jgi:hypothetical protein
MRSTKNVEGVGEIENENKMKIISINNLKSVAPAALSSDM